MKFSETNKLGKHKQYCYDIGTIVSITDLYFEQGSGFGYLVTPERNYTIEIKAPSVISGGYVMLFNHDNGELCIPCSDPRVLYMYLWPFWKHHIGREDEDPPVPTMEEARKWMSKSKIPSKPDSNGPYIKSTLKYFGFNF